jgi:hypothetical protein
LDSGEILGCETVGYLNAHYDRKIEEPKINIGEAKEKLHITSGGCAVRVVPCCDGFRLDTAGGSNGNGRIYSAAL